MNGQDLSPRLSETVFFTLNDYKIPLQLPCSRITKDEIEIKCLYCTGTFKFIIKLLAQVGCVNVVYDNAIRWVVTTDKIHYEVVEKKDEPIFIKLLFSLK